jgi:hypothetical protein
MALTEDEHVPIVEHGLHIGDAVAELLKEQTSL